MIDVRKGIDLKEYPILQDPELYIYVMLNDAGKVKIGKTTNIQQRYESLCGSNGGGNEILKVCCSFCTYLYVIERILHSKFDKFRIHGTEWFYDEKNPDGNKLFYDAVDQMRYLFSSAEFKRCNELRKNIHKKDIASDGDCL